MKPVRIALCGLLAFGVLAHGGVEDWSLAVFETGVGLFFLLWTVFFVLFEVREVVLPSILPPLFAFACVGAFQWFFRRTEAPHETRVQLLLLLADLVFIFLAAQAFRTLQDWREFFWFALLFGFFFAGLGILQHPTFNGKLYLFPEMRYCGNPFWSLGKLNHFSRVAALSLSPFPFSP